MNFEFSILHSSSAKIIGNASTFSNAGKSVATPNLLLASNTGIAPFTDLPSDAADGHAYYPLAAGDCLQIRTAATLASGNQLNCQV